jgi:uncharacterized protein (TIGR00299 family) protein
MHIHLDPVGGIAGDMFAAAVLDAWPRLEEDLAATLARSRLDAIATVAREPGGDGVLTGSRFRVTPAEAERHDHVHRRYRDVVALVGDARLAPPVRARALDVFRLLGEAEAAVHGVALDEVTFHEVGAWDSIADVVSAAWLLEALGPCTWSCGPLPLGRGRVASAHGDLPLPAPATAHLLRGFALHDDGRDGERVTPTGAAILRHLAPNPTPGSGPRILARTGTGFGTRRLEGMSNVLRLLAFEEAGAGLLRERVAVCAFEVDDQTAEDLAVALERLRAVDGVLDVTQAPVHGKKGRIAARVQLLARPQALDAAVSACLDETTTLGVRWQVVERASLARDEERVATDGGAVAVKSATRPDGSVTRKAQMEDLARAGGGHAARQARRRTAEAGPGALAGAATPRTDGDA